MNSDGHYLFWNRSDNIGRAHQTTFKTQADMCGRKAELPWGGFQVHVSTHSQYRVMYTNGIYLEK